MKKSTRFCLPIGLLLLVTTTTSCAGPNIVSLCTAVKEPQKFVGKSVTIDGYVFLGEDGTSISDSRCPGETVVLKFASKKVFNQADVQKFFVEMNKFGRSGAATVTGKFAVTGGSYKQNVIYVRHIKNVRSPK